jgi:hypothetical protein
MKPSLLACVVGGWCLFLLGCGGKSANASAGDALMAQQLGLLQEATAVLKTINDPASLDAARPKLDQIVQRHQALLAQDRTLQPPTKQEADALRQKYAEPYKTAKQQLAVEMARVLQMPGGGPIYKQMAEFMAAAK